MTTNAACPDCPAARLDVFASMLGVPSTSCAFDVAPVASRAPLPTGWPDRYAFGIVRRGVLIRQRIERATTVAVDAAGPGCLFLLERREPRGPQTTADYAATDLLVCLLPRATLERALEKSPTVARDLFSMTQSTLARVERLTAARGASSVRERIATLLCVLADTLSPPRRRERLPHSLQQRDLARLVGVRHETFCRVLGDLEREGAIRRDADGLTILDRLRLENAA